MNFNIRHLGKSFKIALYYYYYYYDYSYISYSLSIIFQLETLYSHAI